MKYKVLLTVAIVFFCSISYTSAQEIYDCTIIDKSGDYVVKNDIINSNNTFCIEIKASEVIIDCDMHSIRGNFVLDSHGIITSSPQQIKNIKIENCIVEEWGSQGITIKNTANITLKNINSSNNHRKGILILNSRRIIIENNLLSNNGHEGIFIENSDKISIKNNNILNNQGLTGIMLKNNVNVGYIEDNTIINNEHGGIRLENNIKNIKIKNNRINSNGIGTGLWLEGNIRRNLIENNDFINNSFGIVMAENSFRNVLKSNRVSENSIGFIIEEAMNNLIYNNFLNNTHNVELYSGSTSGTIFWNTTLSIGSNIIRGPYIGGNYWANPQGNGYSQICVNADDDGFCDEPYHVGINNVDYFPLTI